jgi:hypothetical protein
MWVSAFLYCYYGTAGTRQPDSQQRLSTFSWHPVGAVNAAWLYLHVSL